MTIKKLSDAHHIIQSIDPSTLVLLDIDDTVIAPASHFFRTPYYRTLIDELKETQHPDLEKIVGNWRLKRQTQLVEPGWIPLINFLQEKNVRVLGLTKMDTGTYGAIESMEEWRTQELSSLGVHFEKSPHAAPQEILKTHQGVATFYKGILFTGPHNKKDTLAAFLETQDVRPEHILFFDDREHYIEQVGELAHALGISYTGLQYMAAKTLPGKSTKDIADLQRHHLLTYHEWLEDDDARGVLEAASKTA